MLNEYAIASFMNSQRMQWYLVLNYMNSCIDNGLTSVLVRRRRRTLIVDEVPAVFVLRIIFDDFVLLRRQWISVIAVVSCS